MAPSSTLTASLEFQFRIQFQLKSEYPTTVFCFMPFEPGKLKSRVKIRGASRVLTGSDTVSAIGCVQIPGAFLQSLFDIAPLGKELFQPVAVLPVGSNRRFHTGRLFELEFLIDDLFRSLDNPCKDRFPAVLEQVIRIIFDIAVPFDFGIEWDHEKPPPGAGVIRPDLGQVVCVENERMVWDKAEGVLVFLLSEDVVGRTKLLDGCGIQALPLFQFGGDQKPFSLCLGKFGLDVSLATDREGVR